MPGQQQGESTAQHPPPSQGGRAQIPQVSSPVASTDPSPALLALRQGLGHREEAAVGNLSITASAAPESSLCYQNGCLPWEQLLRAGVLLNARVSSGRERTAEKGPISLFPLVN